MQAQLLLQYAASLPPFPDLLRTPEARVMGCTAQVRGGGAGCHGLHRTGTGGGPGCRGLHHTGTGEGGLGVMGCTAQVPGGAWVSWAAPHRYGGGGLVVMGCTAQARGGGLGVAHVMCCIPHW